MYPIAFVDTEIEPQSHKILDIGSVKDDESSFHQNSLAAFIQFLNGAQFICGHNILQHDIKYIGEALHKAGIHSANIIDTLYLSPLLFPTKPYHALLKDDKLQSEDVNNPLNDCIKAKDLFYDEIAAFGQLDEKLKKVFYLLLKDLKEFNAFFRYINYSSVSTDIKPLIAAAFENEICQQFDLTNTISQYPLELAYCLSLINSFIEHRKTHSITPPWVLKNYPEVERIMFLLRNKPCLTGCTYCDKALNPQKGLQRFFGFSSFRTYGSEPLQEKAVKAAIDNKSILAVFPTGGGKSITFQVPALMSGENSKSLTVIISPLQSLMKDQVDNLEKRGITDAVTINGLLDPIERAKSFERVEDGSATILYISPEALRSRTIERLILGRKIARFVIDEAHCFSSWGHDFRVDYLYIGDFIKSIQEKKNLEEAIPISCFTATAKKKVIDDIKLYFKDKLSLDLELFASQTSRTNLRYKVFEKGNEEEKFQAVRDLLEEKNCPTIIYVSRTKRAHALAERLTEDGFHAKPYHGKMEIKEKTANQNAFLAGETSIMVATSAFGMGVDKKDVGMVIHYDISDSLENYIQEAGRAGRDENMTADCFVLFNEEDLSKHFVLLNQTRLSIKEIQQVWKAIKDITKFRSTVSNSALEIARKAGWDDNVREIETRVITAIAALEEAGYVRRGQNMPRVFANSILSKNAQEAIDKINASSRFEENQKVNAARIIKKLLSSKSRKQVESEMAESRVDYISDHLGIKKEEVINIISLLREEKILADAKDLIAFIKRGDNKNKSLGIVGIFSNIEKLLLEKLEEQEKSLHIKELNEEAENREYGGVDIKKIKTIINFWAIRNWIKQQHFSYSKNHVSVVLLHPKETIWEKMEKRHALSTFITDYLFKKVSSNPVGSESSKDEILIQFSVHELKEAYDQSQTLFKRAIVIDDIEDALFYLSRIESIKIEGGFLVSYNRLTIERLEEDNKKRYKAEDYQKLQQFYEHKIQQIHIVGEYAKRMLSDYRDALQFAEDYFQLNYSTFLNKYFKGSRQNEIRKNLTPAKFRQLFGELSATQLKIINDNDSKYIVIAAGPGSGKTRVLVHKLASLLLMEDVKHEQLLMVTFSRAAATEFKKRLVTLIGNAANYIEIKTFHSYCFDLLGKVGSLEKSNVIIKKTIDKIKNKEVEASRITKTVLVIDEAQDMDEDEFNLIGALMEQNEDMRVIAVGDDDQNIYEFRGARSEHLQQFIQVYKATKYELIENYRSKSNLVDFANQFVTGLPHRLKDTAIVAYQKEKGTIKVIRQQSRHLISPLVNDIIATDLIGTTCVLTTTNTEALQITGLLMKNGIQAKLIQTNDAFNLFNLFELRYFISLLNKDEDIFVINDEVWEEAKKALISKFRNSENIEICNNLIKDFESTNIKKKYKSDFETFVRESKIEDFFNENGETIFVSTIHKAKGKEFDNVFLMLENFNAGSDQAKRQLYVAITRAKTNLIIRSNANYFDGIVADNLERLEDRDVYLPPREIAMSLSHTDVWLGYFIKKQPLIDELLSGERLMVNGSECLNSKGQSVLKFSRSFVAQIEEMERRNFKLKSAKVNFIIYWLKEGAAQEIKIILPQLFFERLETPPMLATGRNG